MQIQILSQNFKLTPAIEKFIQKKMRKYLKLGQKVGKISYKFKSHPAKKSYQSKFSCELNIDIAGGKILVKEASDDLYKLIDSLSSKASREIRKHKEKKRSLGKKGFAQLKKLLRI